jgi:hypothetical protein
VAREENSAEGGADALFESDFPRTYKLKGSYRALSYLCGLTLLMPAYSFLKSGSSYSYEAFVGCLFLALAVFVPISSLLMKVTLFLDRIEIRTIFWTKRIYRHDIEGIQIYISPKMLGKEFIMIFLKSKPNKPIYISNDIEKDSIFRTWMSPFMASLSHLL